MTYDYIQNLKQTHKTLKLINSDNVAMILSFFHFAFHQNRHLTLTQSKITGMLDDYLFELNRSCENRFPRQPKEYLEEFANDKNGFLRKYQGQEDEPLYELTPYAQKALEFFESLEQREFVGSRTKFNIIFDLLEELEFETGLNDTQRIEALERQKAEIDAKIEAIKAHQDMRFDDSRIKEHFMLIEEQARKLKYDFSQIEYNFRELNTLAMERIATHSESKGEVLGSIFEIEQSIREQDQGKSFFAFWQLLTNSQKEQRFEALLQNLYSLEVIRKFDRNQRLKNLKYDLLKSGEKVSKVSAKLIEQLRRFLDDRVWESNRRILDLCKNIEKHAIEIKADPPKSRDLTLLPGESVSIDNVFGKTLFTIKEKTAFVQPVKEEHLTIDLEGFYNPFYIDEEQLGHNIKKLLQRQPQCSIGEIVTHYPVTKGIAELVGYIALAQRSSHTMIDTQKEEILTIEDHEKRTKTVHLPKIIFTKEYL